MGIVTAFGFCGLFGCKDKNNEKSGLTLSESEIVMSVEDIYYLNVNDFEADVAWSSSNESVVLAQATVNKSYACLTAKAEGTAEVKATVGKKSATCKVTVTLVKLSSQFEGNAATIDGSVSDSLKLEIGVAGSENKEVKFESLASGVATVAADGTVTAKRNGECSIKVTHVETGANITVKITVINCKDYIPVENMPNYVHTGNHGIQHVQGMAMDRVGGYLYYTFTDILVKTDLEGNVIGTVTGYMGHMGDCSFNDMDGRLYATLQISPNNWGWEGSDEGWYVAIVDVDKITSVGMSYDAEGLMKVVEMSNIYQTATAELSNGQIGKYGVTGLDGCAFGPKFGTSSGEQYLTIAGSVGENLERTDNDYQVMWQYDVSDWWESVAKPLSLTSLPRTTITADGEYFLLTGNGHYGIQDVCYDDYTKQWYFVTYGITRPEFYEWGYCFVVSAETQPQMEALKGQPTETQGLTLKTVEGGNEHTVTSGIHAGSTVYSYGFYQACTGIVGLGDGYFYVCIAGPSGVEGQYGDVWKYRWTGEGVGFERIEGEMPPPSPPPAE